MPSEFLRCTICPKLPKFSDSSHLLTHVGSKGHLAHLHKLQVRSHQEPEAALRITVYNQWFQEHGVAQLLSERMQQKKTKQADQKAANERRAAAAAATSGSKKKRGRNSTIPQLSIASAYDFHPPGLKTRNSATEWDDLDYTPRKPSRNGGYPMLPSSPPKVRSSSVMEEIEEDDVRAADDYDQGKGSSSPLLKGTKWPGMGLFDAASRELQKKRNQKKDGSVLRRLEKLSEKVDPRETVHSAAGVVLKRRHMDDLENDSPVEGEFTIPPPTPRRRKSKQPRPIQQDKGTRKVRRRSERTRRHAGSPLANPSNLVTSDTEVTVPQHLSSTPTQKRNNKFKLAVPKYGRRMKKGQFRIYEDSSPGFGVDGSSDLVPPAYVDASTTGAQLTYPLPVLWPQPVEPYDPFKVIRSRLPAYSMFEDIGQGKENVNHLSASNGSPGTNQFVNPLFFQNVDENVVTGNPLTQLDRASTVTAAKFDPFQDDDVFVPVRNPLTAAFEHMSKNSPRNHFGNDGVSGYHIQYRQPLFAP